MNTQQEFAAAMKQRLAGEIGNLVLSVIEAQTERDVAITALKKFNTEVGENTIQNSPTKG